MTCSTGAPSASPTASAITGRPRLPPTSREYRTDVACPWSSGQSSSRSSASSTRVLSSAGLCIGPSRALRLLELLFDRLRELGELAEQLDRAIRRAFAALRQLLELCAR